MNEIELLGAAVHEYQSLLTSSAANGPKVVDMNVLVEHLSRAHDWTEEAARAIVTLANEYGALMLRNALALAVALGKEDGNLGF
jgi:hypothetical protein